MDSQIQKKETEKEKLEADYDKKVQTMEDIIKEKEALLAKKNEILQEREEAINDLPPTIDFNTISINNMTGSYVTASGQQPLDSNFVYGTNEVFFSDVNSVVKRCPYCKKTFNYDSTDTVVPCRYCKRLLVI